MRLGEGRGEDVHVCFRTGSLNQIKQKVVRRGRSRGGAKKGREERQKCFFLMRMRGEPISPLSRSGKIGDLEAKRYLSCLESTDQTFWSMWMAESLSL